MARYIDHTILPPPPAKAKIELLTSLTKLIDGYPPRKDYSANELQGLYSGPTSIALLFLHLALSQPKFSVRGKVAKQWCEEYLDHDVPQAQPTVDRSGIINELLAHIAITSCLTHNKELISQFLVLVPSLTKPSSTSRPASNEWLYGRAGVLYLLRLIRTFNNDVLMGQISSAINSLIDAITKDGPEWKWHGKHYLGAAHGDVGIITQVLLSSQRPRFWDWLAELLDTQQEASGNFPSSKGKEGRGELVQFCHGAPGFVVLLMAIEKLINQEWNLGAKVILNASPGAREVRDRLPVVLHKARKCIYQRGVLTKQPCLCHGVSGNAIALTGSQRADLMRWARDGVIQLLLKGQDYNAGDDPWGLFCGEAGRAWSWMVMCGCGKGMIGYSDL